MMYHVLQGVYNISYIVYSMDYVVYNIMYIIYKIKRMMLYVVIYYNTHISQFTCITEYVHTCTYIYYRIYVHLHVHRLHITFISSCKQIT